MPLEWQVGQTQNTVPTPSTGDYFGSPTYEPSSAGGSSAFETPWLPATATPQGGPGNLGDIEMAPQQLADQFEAVGNPAGNPAAELDIDAMVAEWAAAFGATAGTVTVVAAALAIMAAAGYSGYELAEFLAKGGGGPLPPGYITGDPLGIWQDSWGYYHDSASENPLQAYQFPGQAANSARPAGQVPARPGSQIPSGGGIPMPPPGSQASSDPSKGASLTPAPRTTADPITIGLGSVAAVTSAIATALAATHPHCQCTLDAGSVQQVPQKD